MSETEPIPPTSSVTALRIPIIKKGEYDLWSMKMRQYIAITDHILWDIITNGNQTTTDPASPSVSAPKTSLAANARRNNEKALNILLSAIPDRHLLSFHDAVDARSLWKAIKARFGGNEASKKMQKNLLKQQFETFTIGSREELDSAYERFQHILSMLELHDATVSIEDANLKFLRSLPSVWHVVATMIRGQPGLDELDFDDLYNNLKVYEHELKGVSNSSSPNIAFMSTEVKGSTLKQSTAEPAHIPKGYTQAISSKVPTAPNCASHSDEIICSFFAQQASMPTTHDDEDLLQIDEDAMEEIDIRWQVAMITARIRKFMRKTGRSIDLKPKNGITFDKSKIECFNCQKLGHFARECRFAKYQENRANGHNEKRIVAIEDSNSKALVATDNNEDIDWTKEFDAEPVTYAMMALTGVEQDDWSIEFDAEHMHFGQDGLDDFDWSNKADDAPVSLALMATNSEFWATAKSRTVNNISYIDAPVAGKPVTISEASIRSDLLFDDADGIDSFEISCIFTDPSPRPSPSIAVPDSNLEGSGGNHGAQAKDIKDLKAQFKKLKKGVKPLITHHKAWMKSVALKTRLARKTSLKKKEVQKEFVSKQGRKYVKSSKGIKSFKAEPTMHKEPAFEDLDDFVDVDDTLDYMETEDDQDEGRTSSVVLEEKESANKEVSTEAPVSTEKQDGDTTKIKLARLDNLKELLIQNEGKVLHTTSPNCDFNTYSNNTYYNTPIFTI
ncbi:ribonuclease H-like domain-containing protein [Tanacetum coccineum]